MIDLSEENIHPKKDLKTMSSSSQTEEMDFKKKRRKLGLEVPIVEAPYKSNILICSLGSILMVCAARKDRVRWEITFWEIPATDL